MKDFLVKVFLFLIPFIIVLITYFVFDPFKVLYDHSDILFQEDGTPDGFTLNRDYVGTELLLHNYSNFKYDSFIFGSSRASVFRSFDWEQHIETDAPSFHFIGSGESLYGIWKKVKFLDNEKIDIKNALLCIDHNLLGRLRNGDGLISVRHPKVTGNKIGFHFLHLTEYLSTDFFIQYLDFKIFKKKKSYMTKLFDNSDGDLRFETVSNDWYHQGKENRIRKDSIAYYKHPIFYERSTSEVTGEIVIRQEQLSMLKEIAAILEKNNTNLKILINPLYDQVRLNSEDERTLQQIFGASNVWNFSGKNDLTNYKGNFYENSHFKPYVAKKMLASIYN